MNLNQAKDRWGNFLFPSEVKDENGKTKTIMTKAIPYALVANKLQWLIGISNPKEESVHFFPVIAENVQDAARLGYEAFERFVIERPLLKQLKKKLTEEDREASACA